jgi:tripartite-type tricarboxylate transporter receptor subunit TctC
MQRHKRAHPEGRHMLEFPRRRFLYLAAGAVVLPAISRIARAQAYPTRPVRIIVPFAPAGTTDIAARLIGQWLSERLGQQFVVENRPGGGGNIGTEAVVRAPPDGYTFLMTDPSPTIGATLYDKLNFNFIQDIAPVIGVLRSPFVVTTNPAVPAKTAAEFLAYAKANPGKVNMASAGTGSTQHVAGELFKMMTGIDMVHVPYRGGGPAIADLIGGQVQVGFMPPAISLEHIRAGRLRALAVTTAIRFEALPGIPSVREFVPGYEASTWFGLGAPRDTPAEIIEKLNQQINVALADPKIKARLVELGGTVLGGSPAEFSRLIAEDTEKWGRVIKFAGIKPEQ